MKLTRMMVATVLGVALAASAPASAADVAADSKPTKVASDTKEEGQKERLVCKRINSTESRLRSFKACHTAAEWRKIERDAL